MKIETNNLVSDVVISNTEYDLAIFALGYESRASHLLTSCPVSAKKQVAFSFNSRIELHYEANRMEFESYGVEIVDASGDDGHVISNFLEDQFRNTAKDRIKILVDYSSMTRVWYAEIVRFFRDFKSRIIKSVDIHFAYSLSQYVAREKKVHPNIHAGPIRGFSKLSLPNTPAALIIGIGNEKERAFGLSEYLDSKTYLFFTDGSFDKKYMLEVLKENKELYARNSIMKFSYSLLNMKNTEISLSMLCEDLVTRNRIVIAPCGPKPFTLISLLVSTRYHNVNVWRISAGESARAIDKIPTGQILMYQAVFNYGKLD